VAAKQRGIEITAWGVPPAFEVPDVVASPDVAAEWLDELADLGAAVPVWLGELAEPDAAVPG
jgi:hypothetical protein